MSGQRKWEVKLMRLVLDGYGKNSSVLSSRASGLTSLSTEQVKKNFFTFFFFF